MEPPGFSHGESVRLEEATKKKEKVELWQQVGMVHSLTCGNDSLHQDLVPDVREDPTEGYKVQLICKDCDWVQEIPSFVTNSNMDDLRKMQEINKTLATDRRDRGKQ